MATFLVVSFSERVMSFSVISCGFFLSRSSFWSVARFTTARFFCSIESGPSLNSHLQHLHTKTFAGETGRA